MGMNDQKKQSGDDGKYMPRAFPVSKRVEKSAGKNLEHFNLDLTPMMNVMMLLLPLLVTMAVFTRIAIVEFSLPPSAEASASAEGDTKELDISIVITQSGFQIVGTGKKLDMIPRVEGAFQFETLRALLTAIKFQYPSQKSVILVFDGEVLYDDIIKFMDICRESQFPNIGLSGDIG